MCSVDCHLQSTSLDYKSSANSTVDLMCKFQLIARSKTTSPSPIRHNDLHFWPHRLIVLAHSQSSSFFISKLLQHNSVDPLDIKDSNPRPLQHDVVFLAIIWSASCPSLDNQVAEQQDPTEPIADRLRSRAHQAHRTGKGSPTQQPGIDRQ